MTGIDILKAWYETVWVKGDIEAVADFFDVDAMASGLMTDIAAHLEDFQAIVPAVLHSVRELHFSIEDAMEVGDRAWARVLLHTKKAEDMSPVHIPGQVMIRLKGGKIIEAHNCFDFVSYFEQMGNLPKDAVALMLAGEVLN